MRRIRDDDARRTLAGGSVSVKSVVRFGYRIGRILRQIYDRDALAVGERDCVPALERSVRHAAAQILIGPVRAHKGHGEIKRLFRIGGIPGHRLCNGQIANRALREILHRKGVGAASAFAVDGGDHDGTGGRDRQGVGSAVCDIAGGRLRLFEHIFAVGNDFELEHAVFVGRARFDDGLPIRSEKGELRAGERPARLIRLGDPDPAVSLQGGLAVRRRNHIGLRRRLLLGIGTEQRNLVGYAAGLSRDIGEIRQAVRLGVIRNGETQRPRRDIVANGFAPNQRDFLPRRISAVGIQGHFVCRDIPLKNQGAAGIHAQVDADRKRISQRHTGLGEVVWSVFHAPEQLSSLRNRRVLLQNGAADRHILRAAHACGPVGTFERHRIGIRY